MCFRLARCGEDADLCFRLARAGWTMEKRPAAVVEHPTRATMDDAVECAAIARGALRYRVLVL